MDDDEIGKKMDDNDGANDKEENVGDGLVEVGATVEKATTDDPEVSAVVQDVADTSDVEPSDADAADNTKLTAVNEVTDIGDDSSLHVSNLTRNVTKDHLEEIFGSYGEIRNLKLNVGKSVKTLSAIVTFKKDRDAEQALINMDGGQIDGNVVKISFVLVSNSKRTTDEDQQPLENYISTADTPRIQVAILLDVSGSMNGLIEQAKTQLWSMVEILGKANCNGIKPNIEIALYDYGTPENKEGKNFIRQISPFTSDLDSLSASLFSL
eukprot:gene9715-13101_t